VRYLLLLLMIRLHLIGFVLSLGPNISRIITGVVHELTDHGNELPYLPRRDTAYLFVEAEVHYISTDAVHEILGVRSNLSTRLIKDLMVQT